jgi:dihydroorotase
MLTQAMQGRCTVAQVVNWMSTAVAKAYSIPNKGLIQVGYDADLILVDLTNYHPVLRSEVQSKCGWSSFEGWSLTGWPVMTIVNGEVVFNRGEFNDQVRGKALTFQS